MALLRKQLFCTLALLLFWQIRQNAQEIPLQNAGFEEASAENPDRPAGWTVYPTAETAAARFSWSSERAHSGRRSICVVAADESASWLPLTPGPVAGEARSQIARVQAGREYLVAMYAMGEGSGQETAAVALRWITSTGWAPRYEFERFPLGSDWQLITIAGVAPEGADYVCPVLQIRAAETPGKVWFDDVTVADRTGLRCGVSRGPLMTGSGVWRVDIAAANSRQVPMNVILVPVRPSVFDPVPLTLLPGETTVQTIDYEATRRHELAYALTTVEGTPLHVERIHVRSIFEASLLRPRYRSTIFGDAAGEKLSVRCSTRGDDDFLRQTSIRLEIPLPSGEVLATEKRAPVQNDTLTILLPALEVGAYMCRADLIRAGEVVGSVRMPFRCRPDEGLRTRLGDRNELLVSNRPVFPLGFYSIKPEDYARLSADGFNFSLTYSTDVDACAEMARKADEAGLKLIASVIHPLDTREQIQNAVQALSGLPGLLGYYLCDEPGLERPGTSPAELGELYAAAMAADPSHITTVVFCQPSVFELYSETTDVFMVDPYPCRRNQEADLTLVADFVEAAREATRDRKAVWLVPQAFDHVIGPGDYRMPTVAEQRCMCYLGLIHGVKGICWFTYPGFCVNSEEQATVQGKPYHWAFRGSIPDCYPLRYDGMKRIVAEIRELEDVWLAEPSEQHQEILDGKGMVHHRMCSTGPDTYLFTVNPKYEAIAFSCRLPDTWRKAEVLWEDRTLEFADGILTDNFQPLEVHAYRLR